MVDFALKTTALILIYLDCKDELRRKIEKAQSLLAAQTKREIYFHHHQAKYKQRPPAVISNTFWQLNDLFQPLSQAIGTIGLSKIISAKKTPNQNML